MAFAAQMFLPSHCKVIFQVTSSSRCSPVPRCVCVLSPPLSWNSAMPLTYCGASAPWSYRVHGKAQQWQLCCCQAAWWHFPLSNRPPCSPPGCLQTHYLGCTKQLSVLPGMNLDNCCRACAQNEELISPIIQAARSYFPVEPERKARCNS